MKALCFGVDVLVSIMINGGNLFPFPAGSGAPSFALPPGPFLVCLSVLLGVLTFCFCSWGPPLARTLGECVRRAFIPQE